MPTTKIIKRDGDHGIGFGSEWAGLKVDSGDNLLKFNPDGTMRSVVDTVATQTLTNKTLTTPTITTPVLNGRPTGTMFVDRTVKTAVKAISGATLHAGVLNWQNPESTGIIVLRAILDVTTVATGACTADVGVTAVSATTASDTLLDGVDVNAGIAVFDSMNAALDGGANAKAQTLATGKWVTIKEATGDATGLVANLYIQYVGV